MIIAHVTDPHLVAPGETLFGLDPMDRLDQVLRKIEHDYADTRLCVISGDLADRADRRAYLMLRDRLSSFPIPTRLLLGNHDDREVFRSVFTDGPSDIHGFVQGFDDFGHLRVIYLDTLERGAPQGQLCDNRLRWLTNVLADAADRDIVIFTHYPFGCLGLPHFEGMLLRNPDVVMRLIKAHGRVRHIFCGHAHVSMAGQWDGVPYTVSAGTAHHILPDLTSHDARFVAMAPQFDIVSVGAGDVRVIRIDTQALPVLAVSKGVNSAKGYFVNET